MNLEPVTPSDFAYTFWDAHTPELAATIHLLLTIVLDPYSSIANHPAISATSANLPPHGYIGHYIRQARATVQQLKDQLTQLEATYPANWPHYAAIRASINHLDNTTVVHEKYAGMHIGKLTVSLPRCLLLCV